jgi:hypothetical protein
MSESSNMLFVTMLGKADAFGDLTTTNAATKTFTGAGIAVGFTAATAVAEGTTAAAPYTDATTDGLADDGFITSSHTGHTSFDFPYGPTPVPLSIGLHDVRRDADALRRHRLIRLGGRGGCVIRFSGPYHDLDVECETQIDGPWNGWVRLKYEMTGYWTGEPLEVDDKIFLATSRPPFGGLRCWFVCPHLNRRVRKLYLPLGGRHFWSRHAYELAYATQRETK